MRRTEFGSDLLTIALFTFFTVLIWIAAEAYHAYVTSQISEVQEKLILKLDPKLNTSVINDLKRRQQQYPLSN